MTDFHFIKDIDYISIQPFHIPNTTKIKIDNEYMNNFIQEIESNYITKQI